MTSYCDIAPGHPLHGPYHDTEYGFPSRDERVLFERLALEIMQAGLSWEIVLKKRAPLNKAFRAFDVDKVARFGEKDVARLLADEGIIRNRLKIAAIIGNAAVIKEMRQSEGGFAAWLDRHQAANPDLKTWTKIFRGAFRFTGPEVVHEFLMSLGLMPGAHRAGCPVGEKLARQKARKHK